MLTSIIMLSISIENVARQRNRDYNLVVINSTSTESSNHHQDFGVTRHSVLGDMYLAVPRPHKGDQRRRPELPVLASVTRLVQVI